MRRVTTVSLGGGSRETPVLVWVWGTHSGDRNPLELRLIARGKRARSKERPPEGWRQSPGQADCLSGGWGPAGHRHPQPGQRRVVQEAEKVLKGRGGEGEAEAAGRMGVLARRGPMLRVGSRARVGPGDDPVRSGHESPRPRQPSQFLRRVCRAGGWALLSPEMASVKSLPCPAQPSAGHRLSSAKAPALRDTVPASWAAGPFLPRPSPDGVPRAPARCRALSSSDPADQGEDATPSCVQHPCRRPPGPRPLGLG